MAQFSPDGSPARATYLGGSGQTRALGIALDHVGDVYVTGTTFAADFPLVAASKSELRQGPWGPVMTAFLAKLKPNLAELVYSTLYEFADIPVDGTVEYVDHEEARKVAVDRAGNAYVIGYAQTFNNQTYLADAFSWIAGFDSDGQPISSALLNMTPNGDEAYGVAVADNGEVYVVGHVDYLWACEWVDGVGQVCSVLSDSDVFIAWFPGTPGDEVVLLPETTRWKPQRDTSKKIDIAFSSSTPLKSATVTITGPSPVAPITVSFDPGNPPRPYVITWDGFTTGGSGDESYFNRGDYTIAIEGVKEDDGTIESSPADPNGIVSLVAVTRVELCEADNTDDCSPLTTPYPGVSADNPAVGTLAGQDPPQERPGGGKRIFAEAVTPSGPADNRVKVRAIIDPVIPVDSSRSAAALDVPVYFRSFDVDDPAPDAPDLDGDASGQVPSDNRGSPKQGVIEHPTVNVAAGMATATSAFQVSLQPGDNYRIAASTSVEWLNGLQALPSSMTGELAVTAEETNVSEMLTVWRTIHLELDSMALPPSFDHAERNFIQGRVRRIDGDGSMATRLYLAETGFTAVGLADRSPDLDRTSGREGKGRFEKGTIRLGLGAAGVVITELDGNGLNYVRKNGGMAIPFALRDAQEGSAITGLVVGWDAERRRFEVSATIPANTYTNGTLTVGGIEWTVRSTSDTRVMVEDKDLSFFLVDDDVGIAPLVPNPSLLRASDDPTENLLAQAYIRPAYDLPNSRLEAPFNRNISIWTNPDGTDDRRDHYRQVEVARDAAPSDSNAFWAGYAQAAFQPDEAVDSDPGTEDGAMGWTVADISYVFAEGIAEQNDWLDFLPADEFAEDFSEANQRCTAHVLVHEIGHQLGLGVNHQELGGVMFDNCAIAYKYFTATALDLMRWKGAMR